MSWAALHARARLAAARACLFLGPALASAQPQSFDLLPEQTFATFEVLHFGTSTIRGRFGPLSGFVVLDPGAAGPVKGEVNLRIATAGVSTGVGFFDARLRQADLLASDDHPEAFFVASNLRFAGQQLVEVRGEFTFRGQSRPLALLARRYGCWPQDIAGASRSVCGGDFEAELLRSDFGASFGLPFVADRVRLVIQVAGLRR